MERVLLFVVRRARRHVAFVLLTAIALAAASVFLTFTRLEFRTSRNALVSPEREWHQRFLAWRQEFGGGDDVIVAVEGGTIEQRQRFADALAARAGELPGVGRVFHRVDPEPFRDRALLYLDEGELDALAEDLRENEERIDRLAKDPGLLGTLGLIDQQVSEALVGSVVSGLLGDGDVGDEPAEDGAPSDGPMELGFLLTLLEGIETRLADPTGAASFQSPWNEWFGVEDTGGGEGYLTSADDQFHFVLLRLEKLEGRFDQIGPTLDALRGALDELERQHPGVQAGLTGQPVLGSEEVRTSTRDAAIASGVALCGVTLLFAIGFRRWRHALLVVVALGVGILWSAGATTLLVGHLTILSVAFTSFLFGLGVDFGIHLTARFEEERALGRTQEEALDVTVAESGPPIVYGALTTALAFFALAFTDFVGIAELGVIAGSGLLLCLLSTFTVLPALLKLAGGGPASAKLPPAPPSRLAPLFARPALLLGSAVAITLALAAFAPRVRFDPDVLELQARGTEAVELERRLLEAAGRSSAFAVSLVPDLETARALSERLERLPEVARVESLAEVVPANQRQRMERIRALAPELSSLPASLDAPEPLRLPELKQQIDRLRFKVRPSDRWEQGEAPPREQLERAQQLLTSIRKQLRALTPEESESARVALERYQAQLAADLADKLELLREGADPQPMRPADVPDALRERLVGATGKLQLTIYPEENIWRPEALAPFVEAVRRVDPDATGPSMQLYDSSRLMRQGYLRGGLYALAVVMILLLVDFRSLSASLLAAVPLALGAVWTLGVMGLSELDFNLANLVIVPLIIGIGVDTGIHLVHRHRKDRIGGFALLATSTGRAVILSALTSAVGFGSLIIARHQGVQSIGLLLSLGVLLTLLAALIVLAPALRLRRARHAPSSSIFSRRRRLSSS